jgi:F-type H+-transporting ATPase subunit alpha
VTTRALNLGARLTQLLKQPQYSPLSMEEQAVVIYAGTRNYFAAVPENQIGRWERELLAYFHANQKGVLESIRTTKDLKGVEDQLKAGIDAFNKTFA